MRITTFTNWQSIIKTFIQEISGGVAIWAALSMPALMGAAAISVDAARMYNLDQELQSAADALARAGAAELNQQAESINRSKRAISNLVNNKQKFGDQGWTNVNAKSVRFLKSLPQNDADPITSVHTTLDPYQAKYVEVQVTPTKTSMLFPQGVVKSITSVTLEADAVAGFGQGVCGVAPIFVCNPYEDDPNTTIYAAMETREFQRTQVQLKTTKKQYAPGNFGYLDPFDGGGGASAIGDAIAVDIPPVCMSKNTGVTLRPGNINSLRNAINVRFDIYEGSFKKTKTDPRYAPAENVVKGYSGKACKESLDANAMALPRDDCFFDKKGCTGLQGRFGDGDWDFVEYMRVNHNQMSYITIEDTTYYLDYKKHKVTPDDIPSRYAMYRWEIDNNFIPGDLTYGKSSTPEEGIPQCHSYGASTSVADRRIIHAAVLNCTAIQDAGIDMSGRKSGIPVETFVKVFLTEPMQKGQDNTIWGEIIGPVEDGKDPEARQRVSMVR